MSISVRRRKVKRSEKLLHWEYKLPSKIKVLGKLHWRLITGAVAIALLCITVVWSLPVGAASRTHRVISSPENVIWGELFKPNSRPILRVNSGDRVIMETVSHEGILPDQGDTVAFLLKVEFRKIPKAQFLKIKFYQTRYG